MNEFEVWIIVDEDGNYSVGNDADQANELYDSDYNNSGARRVVKITVKMPLPKALECVVNVPAEPENAVVSVE